MLSRDLQSEYTSLRLQIMHQEQLLDQAFSRNAVLSETKKIYHQLKILKDRFNHLSELNELNTLNDVR